MRPLNRGAYRSVKTIFPAHVDLPTSTSHLTRGGFTAHYEAPNDAAVVSQVPSSELAFDVTDGGKGPAFGQWAGPPVALILMSRGHHSPRDKITVSFCWEKVCNSGCAAV